LERRVSLNACWNIKDFGKGYKVGHELKFQKRYQEEDTFDEEDHDPEFDAVPEYQYTYTYDNDPNVYY
jgi:hypothetical protein